MRKEIESSVQNQVKIPPSRFWTLIKQTISWMYMIFLILFISFSLIGKFGFFPSNQVFQMRTVISGSMEPNMPIGSLIVTKKVPIDRLEVGNIVSFESNGEIVTHRIAKMEEGKIFTKGDANPSWDEGYVEEVIGKVLFHVPKIGIFFQMIQTPRGTLALVMTIGTFILLDRFIRLLWTTEYEK